MKGFVKKGLACLVTAALVLGLLAGCAGGQQETPEETKNVPPVENVEGKETAGQPAETQSAPTDEQPDDTPTASGWKIGLGVVTNVNGSKDAGDADGLAKSYSIAAAILLDEAGVIRDCVIDALQTAVNFDAKGQLTTDLATVFQTKNQLGQNYGLHAVSSLGKEWNEQAEAFAQFCVGKTVAEVLGIELVDKKAVDTVSGVTIKVNDFIKAIEKADQLAIDAEPSENSQLQLLISTDVSGSKNAEEGAEGKAEAYTTYVAAAVNEENVITGCFIDASQASVKFDTTGKITSDITAEVLTKDELGDNYGMRFASSIGKEWNEQALGFAQYCNGKTVADVIDMELDGGRAVEADVVSSATISIGNWLVILGQLLQ